MGYQYAARAYHSERSTRHTCARTAWPTWVKPGRCDPAAEIKEYAGATLRFTTVALAWPTINDVLMEQLADKGNALFLL